MQVKRSRRELSTNRTMKNFMNNWVSRRWRRCCYSPHFAGLETLQKRAKQTRKPIEEERKRKNGGKFFKHELMTTITVRCLPLFSASWLGLREPLIFGGWRQDSKVMANQRSGLQDVKSVSDEDSLSWHVHWHPFDAICQRFLTISRCVLILRGECRWNESAHGRRIERKAGLGSCSLR